MERKLSPNREEEKVAARIMGEDEDIECINLNVRLRILLAKRKSLAGLGAWTHLRSEAVTSPMSFQCTPRPTL